MKTRTLTSNNERGATMVEFAITCLVFLLLLFFTIEISLMGFRALTAQYVASTAARQAALGTQTVAQIRDFTVALANQLAIPVNAAAGDIEICPARDINPATLRCTNNLVLTNPAALPASANQFVAVRVQTQTFVMLGDVHSVANPLRRRGFVLFGLSVAQTEPPP